MKEKLYKEAHFLLMCCSIAICILIASCSNENMGPPTITAVRNYVPSPNDIIIDGAVANEQWVVIEGHNLQDALKISFNGVVAQFKSTFLTANSAVVQIPPIIFSTIDEDKLYSIEYVTPEGTVSFSFKLGPDVPVITAISDVFAQPADSVHIYGKNFVLVKEFTYGGTAITSFKSKLDGTDIGFKMPSPAPTSGDVVITTVSGTASFKIVALPTITRISYENPVEKDSIYVYGTYLKSIQSISFGGTPITSYKPKDNGNAVGFVMPATVQTGVVSITTAFGTASTIYNVNDINTGIIANMEWGDKFGWQWWGGSNLAVSDPSLTAGWISLHTDMAINKSMFITIADPILAAGARGNAIPIGDAQWIPTANLNDDVNNWAIKFEVNIPQLWNGSTIAIQTGYASAYTARFEPWQITSDSSAAYSTKGWLTVTMPLSAFRAKDPALGEGKGASITKLADIVGPTGKTGCTIFDVNYGKSATTTGLKIGIDNVRIIKIK